MILRSQLRMNKNIVFPFISCIMIMLTLLVLIHKSADELSAAKKEITLCKQQHDSVFTQLQSAIEYKLRLEKSLQNEKTDGKQKIEEIQIVLAQEKEDRRKEKEEADTRFEALNQRYSLKENEFKEADEESQKLRKKLLNKEEEISKLNAKLVALRTENENSLAAKDKLIEDLQGKLKKQIGSPQFKKVTPETKDNVPILQHGEAVHSSNSTTPGIDSLALAAQAEDQQRLVAPPPPPAPPQSNDEPENALQKQMRKDLNPRPNGDLKAEENVMKAPEHKDIEKHGQLEMSDGYNKNDLDGDKNSGNMFIPRPNFEQNAKPVQASVASNAADSIHVDDPQQVLPLPNQNANDKGKEIPRQIKDYVGGDYKEMGEDEGEEGEYVDNDIGKVPPPKKVDSYIKEKQQEEPIDGGESVVLQPK